MQSSSSKLLNPASIWLSCASPTYMQCWNVEYARWQGLHLSRLCFHTTASHYMPKSQNIAAERRRQSTKENSFEGVLLDSEDCFPNNINKFACKVQLNENEDLQEEISHHYTYAMSALYVPTDFMWAAGIYFRNQRVIFLFQLSKETVWILYLFIHLPLWMCTISFYVSQSISFNTKLS